MRKILSLLILLALVACSSEKKSIQNYLDNNFPETEIDIVGDVVVDSVFCPLAALDSVSSKLLEYRIALLDLLEQNPDSAFKLADQLNTTYSASNAFANMAYPKGKNNRLGYQVKCKMEEEEKYLTFYKNENDDKIEVSTFEVDESIDSLMQGYNRLMNGIKVILDDRKTTQE
jgi:hypothetical protein